MIDNISIFLSTILTVYVVWRAMRLDRKLPWFPTEDQSKSDDPKSIPTAPGLMFDRAPLPIWRR